MNNKTMYYDGLRGPIAVKPLAIVHPDQVELKVTAKGDNARPYNTGDIIRVPAFFVVYLLSGGRCRTVAPDEIRQRIAKDNRGQE